MEKLKQLWRGFEEKNPKASQWVREGGLFFLVSNAITIIRGLLISLLQNAFTGLGNAAIGFPNITLTLFGISFPWYIIGASEEQGGVSYFVAFLISLWLCEIINFFLQRKFVFRSNGNIGRQFVLYFLAFLLVTCVVNSINSIWVGLAIHFLPPLIYNLVTTFLTGGVAMVVFFFANRFIFKESEKK